MDPLLANQRAQIFWCGAAGLAGAVIEGGDQRNIGSKGHVNILVPIVSIYDCHPDVLLCPICSTK
jgi:hypothetical protein